MRRRPNSDDCAGGVLNNGDPANHRDIERLLHRLAAACSNLAATLIDVIDSQIS